MTKTNRDHGTRIRNRKGQYVEECKYCTCPDGCACEGNGCFCGSDKAKEKEEGK